MTARDKKLLCCCAARRELLLFFENRIGIRGILEISSQEMKR